MKAPLKNRVFDVIESSITSDWKGLWFDRFMIALIIANVAAVVMETVEEIALAYSGFFHGFELFSVFVFTVEYILRLWVCTEQVPEDDRPTLIIRLKYMITFGSLIDLIAILPFYLSMFVTVDLRFMRVFRLLRLLKLTRYSSAMDSFVRVIQSERRPLMATMMIMAMLLVFASSIVFMFEKDAQPEDFASIPHAMWWALATLTTVGYGDVTPITLGGRLFGALIMVLGIGMFALPTGILATGFAREVRKNEFEVTWRLVANVPLFAKLDALLIAYVAELLQPIVVSAKYTILKRDEPADSMYFIASGEVEVDVESQPIILKSGDFFGEIAILKDSARTATVIALTECKLMVLNVDDFRKLLDITPNLRKDLTSVMKERLAQLEGR